MNISGNTILITGGATGIGLSLAEHLISAGNEVIICGRREKQLLEAKAKLIRLHTKTCDVSSYPERAELVSWITSHFPTLNILINNAGIQRMLEFNGDKNVFDTADCEINTNFSAPVHLCNLLIPHLERQNDSAIINVTSGLGFVPIARMPVYCATKAALHSFSVSLRHQLKNTSIKVFELIPPTVDTELDQGARERRGQAYRGIPPAEVAVAALDGMKNDLFEITVGQSNRLRNASLSDFNEIFNQMNH